MATGVVLRATMRGVRLMLLFGSGVRSHMPYEATLARWYGSMISSSKKMSSPSLVGLQLALVYPTTSCLYWVKFRRNTAGNGVDLGKEEGSEEGKICACLEELS